MLMVAHGVVKAGVDLSQIKPADLQITDTKITLKLPSASITDDGVGGGTNDVADCSGIGRTSVERNGSWPTAEASDA